MARIDWYIEGDLEDSCFHFKALRQSGKGVLR